MRHRTEDIAAGQRGWVEGVCVCCDRNVFISHRHPTLDGGFVTLHDVESMSLGHMTDCPGSGWSGAGKKIKRQGQVVVGLPSNVIRFPGPVERRGQDGGEKR